MNHPMLMEIQLLKRNPNCIDLLLCGLSSSSDDLIDSDTFTVKISQSDPQLRKISVMPKFVKIAQVCRVITVHNLTTFKNNKS